MHQQTDQPHVESPFDSENATTVGESVNSNGNNSSSQVPIFDLANDGCQQKPDCRQFQLISRTQKLIAPRNFQAEIRGQLDVENYLLNSTALLLDVDETDLEQILLRMVEEKPYRQVRAGKLCRNAKISSGNCNNGTMATTITTNWPGPYIPFGNIKQKLFATIGGEDNLQIMHQQNGFDTNAMREYMQAMVADEHEGILLDESWFAIYCSMSDIPTPRISLARLRAPTNFGPGLGDVCFIVVVITPIQQKETKRAVEIARTFGTLLADVTLRSELTIANNEQQFLMAMCHKAQLLATIRVEHWDKGKMLAEHKSTNESGISTATNNNNNKWYPGRGVVQDLRRRLPYYKSDFLDGIVDSRSRQKTVSTVVFLFFIVLPTAIALGMLNEENTHDRINVKKVILGQWIGGLLFGIFGGQLYLVVLTSPPISIYIRVIDQISHTTGFDFYQLYTGIGIWCCFYLILFALLEASNIMKYAKRSLEELFSMFIASTLSFAALKASVGMLDRARLPHCFETTNASSAAAVSHLLPLPPSPPSPPPSIYGVPTPLPPHLDPLNCNQSVGLLFILLVFGTAWLAKTLSNFRLSPFLGKRKREIISDYALPLAVCAMTLIANSNWFNDVPKETFNLDEHTPTLTLGPFWRLPWKGQLICCVLGFPLTILFAMDQMVVTNTVDNSQNKLKKGPAANWDFLVVAFINIPLSLFGLPWMHAALPQSFLHLKAQADIEDRLVNGTVQPVIVKNRESRLATIFAHLLIIPTYCFALHLLRHFPTSVFNGVFLFLAASSTIGNELCQRALLLFTEQRSYPPTHYIRRVPQRIVHLFTAIELLQLAVLLGIGHFPWPVLRLLFPVALIVFIPLRAFLLPCFIKKEHLDVLDGTH